MAVVQFPDGYFYDTTGLDSETIEKAIANVRKQVEEKNAVLQEAPDPNPGLLARTGQLLESGYRESVAAGAEGLAKLDDAILGKDLFDEQGLLDFAERNREEAREIPAIQAIQEAEGVTDVFKSGASYLVQSLPEMSPIFAAGGLGFAIGGPMGAAVGAGLATIPKALPFLGRNIEEFKETNKKDPNQEELVGLLATAGVQSALDTAIAFIAPYTKVLKGSPSLATNLFKRAVQGTVIEGSTELTQDALQILSANDYDPESLKSPESIYRLTEAALAGGLVGSQIGVITSPFTKESPVKTGAPDDAPMAQAFKSGQLAEQPTPEPETLAEETTEEKPKSTVDFRNEQGRSVIPTSSILDKIYDTPRNETQVNEEGQSVQDVGTNAALDEEISILDEALKNNEKVTATEGIDILNKPENQKRIDDARKNAQSQIDTKPDRPIQQNLSEAVDKFVSVRKTTEQRGEDASIALNPDGSIDNVATEQNLNRYKIATKYFDARLNDLSQRGTQGKMLAESIREEVLLNPERNANNLVASFAAADAAVEVLGKNNNVAINFLTELEAKDSQKKAHGLDVEQKIFATGSANRSTTKPVINLALTLGDPNTTLTPEALQQTAYHEAFHTLQNFYGKHKPKFKQLLKSYFGEEDTRIDGKAYRRLPGQIRRMMSRYNRQYHQALLNGAHPPTAREMQAQLFEAFKRGKQAGDPTPMGGLFGGYLDFVFRFLPRLKNLLNGYGYRSLQDLYEGIPRNQRKFKTPKSLKLGDAPLQPQPPRGAETPQDKKIENEKDAKRVETLQQGKISEKEKPSENKLNIDDKEVDASILRSTINNPVIPYDPTYNPDRQPLNHIRESFQGDVNLRQYTSKIIAALDFPKELNRSTMEEVQLYYKQKLQRENPRAFIDQYKEADAKFVDLDVAYQSVDLSSRVGRNTLIDDIIANLYRQYFKLPENQKNPLVYDVSFKIDDKLSQFDESDRSVYQGFDYNKMPKSSLLDIMAKITSTMRDIVDRTSNLNGFTFSPYGRSTREMETKRRLYNTVISSKQFKAMFPELGTPFTIAKTTLTDTNYDIIIPTKNSEHTSDSIERADRSYAIRVEINNHVDNDTIFEEIDASIPAFWNNSALNPLSGNYNISNPATGRVELADANKGEISTLFEVNVKSQDKPLRLVVYHALPSLKIEGSFGEAERTAVESNLMSMRSSLSSQEMAAIMANFATDTKLLKTDFTVNGAFGTTQQKVTPSEAIDIMKKVMASTKFAWDYYKDRSNGLLNMGNSEKKNDFYVRLFSDFTRQDGTIKPSAVREQLFPDLKKPVPYTMEGILESDVMDNYNTGSIVPIKQIDGIKKESKAFQDFVHKKINLQQYAKMIGETSKEVLDRTNDSVMEAVDTAATNVVPNTKLNKRLLESRIEHIVPPTEDDAGIIVYNGGGGTFVTFKTSMIGKGEGAIAFGWGLYFADLTGTGLSYALQKLRSTEASFTKSKDANQTLIFSLKGQELISTGLYNDYSEINEFEGRTINPIVVDPFESVTGMTETGGGQAFQKVFTGKTVAEGLKISDSVEKKFSTAENVARVDELPKELGELIDYLNEKKINPENVGGLFNLEIQVDSVSVLDTVEYVNFPQKFNLVSHNGKVGFYGKGRNSTALKLPLQGRTEFLRRQDSDYINDSFYTFDELVSYIKSTKKNNDEAMSGRKGFLEPENPDMIKSAKESGLVNIVSENQIGIKLNYEYDVLDTQEKLNKKILYEFSKYSSHGRDEKLTEYLDELDYFQENDYARDELSGSFPENKVDTLINSIKSDTPKLDLSRALQYVKQAYDEDRKGVSQDKLDKFNFRDQVARLLKVEKTNPNIEKNIKSVENAVNDNARSLFSNFKKDRLNELKQEIQFIHYFIDRSPKNKNKTRDLVYEHQQQLYKEYEALVKLDPYKDINAKFNIEVETSGIKSSLRKAELEVDTDLQEGNMFKFETPVSAQKLLDTLADREIFTAQTATEIIPIPLYKIRKPFHSGKLNISYTQSDRKDGDLIDIEYYFPNEIAKASESNRTPMQDRTPNYDNRDDYTLGRNTGQFDRKKWEEQYGNPLKILTKIIRKHNGDSKKVRQHADELLLATLDLEPKAERKPTVDEEIKNVELQELRKYDKLSEITRNRITELENDFKNEYYKANNPTNLKVDSLLNKIKELLIEIPRFGKKLTQEEADILNVDSSYKQFIASPVYAYMFKNFIKDPIYEDQRGRFKTNQISARSFYENLTDFFGGKATQLGAFANNGTLYKPNTEKFGAAEKASLALKRLGFVGHRYNERMSRRGKEELFGLDGDHNYVIYDENVVSMLESNGSPIANTKVIDTDIVGDIQEDAAIIFQTADPRFTQGMQQVFADPRRETLRFKILNSLTPLNTLHKRFGRAFINQAIFGLRVVRDRDAEFAYQKAVNEGDPNPQRKMLSYGEGAFRITEMAQNSTGRNQMLAEEGSFTLSENGTPMLNPNTKGLIEIFRPIGQGADYRKFGMYVVAKRAQRLLAEGRERLLTDQHIAEGLAYGRANPVFDQVFEEYNKFNKSTIDFMVSAGAIDRETANGLTDTADYVPFYRIIEDSEYTEGMFGAYKKADPRKIAGTTAGFDNPDARVKEIFKKLKGGEEKIGDLYTNIFSNQQAMISAGLKNLAMQRVVLITEGNKSYGMYRGVQAPRHLTKQEAQNNRNHFTYREDGKTKYYDVGDDGELLTALRTFEPIQMQGVFKIMQKIGRLFRDAITATPGFMFANIIRGELAGLVTVDAPLIPLVDTAKGLKNALQNADSIKEMKTIAGFGGYNFGDVASDQADRMKRLYRKHEGYTVVDTPQRLSDMFFNLVDRVQSFGEATELATRDGVYRANLRNGMDKATAAHEALNLINFNRRGNPTSFAAQSLAVLLPLVPFLNARLQGLYRTGTAMSGTESNGMRTALKGVTLMGLSVALYGIMSQRDEWEDEPLYRKLNYYIIYVGDKKYLIPKPFEIGAIFSTLPEVFLDGIRNKDGEYVSQAVQQLFLNNFSFNPIPQAVLPLVEVGTNYDFFRNRDLESMGVRGLPTNMRSYSSTSQFAKLVGQASSQIGISPIEVEQLINGYFGSMGSLFLSGTDAILSGMGVVPSRPTGIMGSSIGDPVADVLGISRFYKENEGDRASRWLSEFYDLKREVDQIYRGVNKLREEGDFEAAREFRKENKSLLGARQRLNAMYTQLMDINKRMSRVRISTLSGEEKYNELKKLTIRRNQVAKKVQAIKDKIRGI